MIELDRKAVRAADMQTLKDTHEAVRGWPLEEGLSIEVARIKVDMTLMCSADIVGRIGVPPGWIPQAMTLTELRKRAKMNNKEKQLDDVLAEFNFKPGSMAHQLYATTQAMPKIEPREKRKMPERVKITHVKYTGKGTSKPQAGSLRNTVLQYIMKQPDGCDVDAMEAELKFPVRGHIQKLLEKDHLEVVK